VLQKRSPETRPAKAEFIRAGIAPLKPTINALTRRKTYESEKAYNQQIIILLSYGLPQRPLRISHTVEGGRHSFGGDDPILSSRST
jgi:hypothetical protein